MESLATNEALDEQYPVMERINSGRELQEIIATSGISVRIWRLYAYFWLVCLFFPIFSPLQIHFVIVPWEEGGLEARFGEA